jgi:molybdopterin converting factor small subunit
VTIKVKLFAGLKHYVPGSADLTGKEEWDVAEGTTIGGALEMLNLPDGLNIVTLVNGVHCTEKETILREGDVLLLYPSMSGG